MYKPHNLYKLLKIFFFIFFICLFAFNVYARTFYVQLCTFKSYKRAKKVIDNSKNFPYRIFVTKIKKFYVVFVGPLSSMKEVKKTLVYFKKNRQEVIIRKRNKPYSDIILESKSASIALKKNQKN